MALEGSFRFPLDLWYDGPFWRFLAAGAITSGLGFALGRLTAGAAGRVGVREGFLVVALTWLLAAAFASIPYLFEGGEQLSNPLDAYFEGMSGFTTTGASVVTDFDETPETFVPDGQSLIVQQSEPEGRYLPKPMAFSPPGAPVTMVP